MPEYVATTEDAGQRADIVLTHALAVARAQVQKRIKGGEILLGGEPFRANLPVEAGMRFTYSEVEPDRPSVAKAPPPLLDVLYEDGDVIVINKQAGVLTHPTAAACEEPSIVDALFERYPEIADVGEDPMRPGIVHRLDKDVSGALIIAKTDEAFAHLKEQFQKRRVEKEYIALVYGNISKDSAVIRFPIARAATGLMVARPEGQEGKEAITRYEVLERFRTMTLLRVKIETGRTHQIRVHMRAIDHPVVGDALYGKKRMKNIRPLKLGRLFLHAERLVITLPSGERKAFAAPLPADLEQLLIRLPKA